MDKRGCMRIGINVSFLRKQGTGIGQVTVHVVRELIAQVHADAHLRNHKFFLYCEEEPTGLDVPRNFTVRAFLPHYRRDDLIRKMLWEKHLLPRRARRDKCDVLISLYQSATVIPYTDMQHIMVVHDIIPHVFPAYLNNMRKRFYWKHVCKGMYSARTLVAVSTHTKDDVVERLHVTPERVIVAPIAVDPIFATPVTAQDSARVMTKLHLTAGYIYAAGLEMRKNAARTVRAYALLREMRAKRGYTTPDLVISGKLLPQLAPLVVDVERLVAQMGLADVVHAVDFVPQQDLPAMYKNAVMFVFPSQYEGFGMPVLEAMHVGTPVITCNDTSIGEVGGDAVVYVAHDDAALAAAMDRLLDDAPARAQYAHLAQQRARQFSWRTFTTQLCTVAGIASDSSSSHQAL